MTEAQKDEYIALLEALYTAAVCMSCADELAEEMAAIEDFQEAHNIQ